MGKQSRRRTQRQRVTTPAHAPVAEMMGRTSYDIRAFTPMAYPSVDATRPDYVKWNKVWRVKWPGLRLAGLFAKPITQHVGSWTLGKGFGATTGDDATDDALADFVDDALKLIIGRFVGGLRHGDAYAVVNADGTLTAVPPDQVWPIMDDDLGARVVGYKIVTTYDKGTVTDEYYADKRVRTVKRASDAAPVVETFANPTGRIAVIPFHNGREDNELYGHPEYESLEPAWMEYDDVLTKGLTGLKVMGVPIPAFEDVADVDAPVKQLGGKPETYRDYDGATESRDVVRVSRTGATGISTSGKFNFKAPPPFMDQLAGALHLLFYLTLEHIGVPEWVWGGHINSSKASVDAQLPAWQAQVDQWRLQFRDFLQALCETWLAVVSMYTPNVKALPVAIDFPPITAKDMAMVIQQVRAGLEFNIIRDATAVAALHIEGVEDAEAEVEAARAERQERAEADDSRAFERAMQQQAQTIEDAEDEEKVAV